MTHKIEVLRLPTAFVQLTANVVMAGLSSCGLPRQLAGPAQGPRGFAS